jgi:transposase
MDRRSRAERDANIVATVLGGSTQLEAAGLFSVAERTAREKMRQWRAGRIELWRASAEVLEREEMRVVAAIKALDVEAIGVTAPARKVELARRYEKLFDARLAFARALKRYEHPDGLPSVDFMRELNVSLRRLLAKRRVDRRTVEAVTEETMRVFDEFGGARLWGAMGQLAPEFSDS